MLIRSRCVLISNFSLNKTHLDLLSIPQLGWKNVKTFRWDQRVVLDIPRKATLAQVGEMVYSSVPVLRRVPRAGS